MGRVEFGVECVRPAGDVQSCYIANKTLRENYLYTLEYQVNILPK